MDIYPIHEAFVYKWTNTHTNKIYIGKHKGTPDDGYISSGKAFISAYYKNPDHFERSVIWQGSNTECLQKEWEFIKEAVSSVGWKGLYNITHWQSISQWKRICMCCGKWCDPSNEEWADHFEQHHFENCSQQPHILKAKQIDKENSIKERNTPKQQLILSNAKQRKLDISLCHSDNEIYVVNKYYKLIKQSSSKDVNRELKRLRKWIDEKLYKNQ